MFIFKIKPNCLPSIDVFSPRISVAIHNFGLDMEIEYEKFTVSLTLRRKRT